MIRGSAARLDTAPRAAHGLLITRAATSKADLVDLQRLIVLVEGAHAAGEARGADTSATVHLLARLRCQRALMASWLGLPLMQPVQA